MPTIQYSTKLRNAQMDMVMAVLKNLTVTNSAISGTPTAPTLKILGGSGVTMPANCAAADTGTVLATINLTTTSFAAASSGSVAKSGTWNDISADWTGNAVYFRIYDSAGVCHIQGNISTVTAGTGALQLDTTAIVSGQIVNISDFTLTAGNS